MDVASFAELSEEFLARILRHPWCNLATVDRRGRPRSRIVHPVWDGSDGASSAGAGPTGWLGTRAHSHKIKHLAQTPYVSLAYVADLAKPVYVDCAMRYVDDLAERRRVWALIAAAPAPMGYDPAPIFEVADHPGFALLELVPWRVELANLPGEACVWHRRAEM
jgi:hypothetical protein